MANVGPYPTQKCDRKWCVTIIEHKAQIKHVNKKQLANNTLCLQSMFTFKKI